MTQTLEQLKEEMRQDWKVGNLDFTEIMERVDKAFVLGKQEAVKEINQGIVDVLREFGREDILQAAVGENDSPAK